MAPHPGVLDVKVAIRQLTTHHRVAVALQLGGVTVATTAPEQKQREPEERGGGRERPGGPPNSRSRSFASSSASRCARIVFWSTSREITVE